MIEEYDVEIKLIDINSDRICSILGSINGNLLYESTLNTLIKDISMLLLYDSYTSYSSKAENEVKWYKVVGNNMKNIILTINKVTDTEDNNTDEERANRIYISFRNMINKNNL